MHVLSYCCFVTLCTYMFINKQNNYCILYCTWSNGNLIILAYVLGAKTNFTNISYGLFHLINTERQLGALRPANERKMYVSPQREACDSISVISQCCLLADPNLTRSNLN